MHSVIKCDSMICVKIIYFCINVASHAENKLGTVGTPGTVFPHSEPSPVDSVRCPKNGSNCSKLTLLIASSHNRERKIS